MRFFWPKAHKIIALMFVLILFANCSPRHIHIKAPDYPSSIISNSQLNVANKISILLLPVSDARNVHRNYWGQGGAWYYYFTEPISEIVKKAIQTELINYGYDVLLCDEIQRKSLHSNLPEKSNPFYLRIHATEFLGNSQEKSVHALAPSVFNYDVSQFSITLNAILIDGKGEAFARNQFNHSERIVKSAFLASHNADDRATYLMTRTLPKVLKNIIIWIDNNLSVRFKDLDKKQPVDEEKIFKKLEELKEMKEKGLITEDEYHKKKKEILRKF